jgi:hypothetical protein
MHRRQDRADICRALRASYPIAMPSCAIERARRGLVSAVNELARREYRKTNRFVDAARTGTSAEMVGQPPAVAVRSPRRPAAAHPRGEWRVFLGFAARRDHI